MCFHIHPFEEFLQILGLICIIICIMIGISQVWIQSRSSVMGSMYYFYYWFCPIENFDYFREDQYVYLTFMKTKNGRDI